MPCQDYRDNPPVSYRDNPETKKRLDRATRILCGVLKQMTDKEITLMSDETQVWWAKHQLEDRKREAAETAEAERRNKAAQMKRALTLRRKEALKKLTVGDKKALGL